MQKTAMAIGTILIMAAAGGCSGGASVTDATKEIDHFHQQLNAGQMTAIWDSASPEMHNAIGRDKFSNFLSTIHRKLGQLKGSTQAGWNVNYTTSGSFTTVAMQSNFANGKGDEEFVFKKTGDHQALAGYHINSMELMMN